MNKELIAKAVEAEVAQRGCFLVDVTVSKDNDVEVIIEKEVGDVDWEDCSAIDKVVHEAFDQDVEDYALTVSSAGLDRPFKVLKQFRKAIGTKVEVWLKGGKKVKGTLEAATEADITVDGTLIGLDGVNRVMPYIEF
ncbi:MAG: ribosome assembly cofactor RimP [Bacteroidales bacterium]|nr:ribosome assembly cofactor RimP [Bacteroidales bacterium]